MKRWIIEDMINRIDNWEGSTVYVGSLSTYIYQSVIANGSVLCNTYATREWIGKYLNDIADVIEGSCTLEEALVKDTRYDNLFFIPAPQTNSSGSPLS